MVEEIFLSGYCRALDASRTVTVEQEADGTFQTDCCYENCPHAPVCAVARDIDKLTGVGQ